MRERISRFGDGSSERLHLQSTWLRERYGFRALTEDQLEMVKEFLLAPDLIGEVPDRFFTDPRIKAVANACGEAHGTDTRKATCLPYELHTIAVGLHCGRLLPEGGLAERMGQYMRFNGIIAQSEEHITSIAVRAVEGALAHDVVELRSQIKPLMSVEKFYSSMIACGVRPKAAQRVAKISRFLMPHPKPTSLLNLHEKVMSALQHAPEPPYPPELQKLVQRYEEKYLEYKELEVLRIFGSRGNIRKRLPTEYVRNTPYSFYCKLIKAADILSIVREVEWNVAAGREGQHMDREGKQGTHRSMIDNLINRVNLVVRYDQHNPYVPDLTAAADRLITYRATLH
ncbi:MAG: hypothetical protein N2691_02390 [Patescibacteria group bacterium]|nr:hypothetical protein [Patescibacteria group bacterium]